MGHGEIRKFANPVGTGLKAQDGWSEQTLHVPQKAAAIKRLRRDLE
jgi:hypothetical protein